jgi:hypothetical protein
MSPDKPLTGVGVQLIMKELLFRDAEASQKSSGIKLAEVPM